MIRLLFCVLPVVLVSACASSGSDRFTEREDFAAHFETAEVAGTFVLYDRQADHFFVHDLARAEQRFIPASTFKIVNTLIALETQSIADTSTVLPWDGQQRSVGVWNRDHSLTTAFRNSVVWYYQEVARRIGAERMRTHLRRIGYGNNDIGGGIDQFWLTGSLRISALEQIELLVALHEEDVPFSKRTVEAVKEVMVEGRTPDHVLRAKTGWAVRSPADIGWYVGYVEREGKVYFFALNMDIEHAEQAAHRRGIAQAILKDLGLL